jgi:hypothetical protein
VTDYLLPPPLLELLLLPELPLLLPDERDELFPLLYDPDEDRDEDEDEDPDEYELLLLEVVGALLEERVTLDPLSEEELPLLTRVREEEVVVVDSRVLLLTVLLPLCCVEVRVPVLDEPRLSLVEVRTVLPSPRLLRVEVEVRTPASELRLLLEEVRAVLPSPRLLREEALRELYALRSLDPFRLL